MVIIYALKCRVNGKVYVGSTKKLPKRIREHRSLLRRGLHSETELQQDWSLHGEAEFSFYELETFVYDESLETRRSAELKWMEQFSKDGLLYNKNRISMALLPEAIAKGVQNAHGSKGNRWTPEANAARSAAQKGKPKGHGAKISATKKALGQRPSLEAARLGGIAATMLRYGTKQD